MRLALLLPGTRIDSPLGHYSPRVVTYEGDAADLRSWVESRPPDLAPYPASSGYLGGLLEGLGDDLGDERFPMVCREVYVTVEDVAVEVAYGETDSLLLLALLKLPADVLAPLGRYIPHFTAAGRTWRP